VVYGGKDKLVPHAGGRVSQTFPDARVVLLPSSGHVAQMEHPRIVARLVREHLDRAG
jgi:pimeloyl-ACP methyl ester carboxylesterase